MVNIHGKEYSEVSERLLLFRAAHPDYTIDSDLIEYGTERVVVKARISDGNGHLIATGLAEETRSASSINKVSAVENCETSAVGRALAFFGLAGTGPMASADEMLKAAVNEFAQCDDIMALKNSFRSWHSKFKNTPLGPEVIRAKDARKHQLEIAA